MEHLSGLRFQELKRSNADGDSGEGLVDAEARIQERIEELQRAREVARRPPVVNPEQKRKLESLRLGAQGTVSSNRGCHSSRTQDSAHGSDR